MAVMIKQQRILLLKRLDKLSADLKAAKDSEQAEHLLEEMRNVGMQLQALVKNHVPDDEQIHYPRHKELGAIGGRARVKNATSSV